MFGHFGGEEKGALGKLGQNSCMVMGSEWLILTQILAHSLQDTWDQPRPTQLSNALCSAPADS